MGSQYAVVTRVTPVREGGRVIVHAYGPVDRNGAARIASGFKRDAALGGYADRSEVSVCKLLSDEEPG